MSPRMTLPVILILGTMVERPDEEWYGLDLIERVDLKSGTIYPVLVRLEQAGWLESRWEDVDPSEMGRPRRRMYRLTAVGRTVAGEAVASHLEALNARQHPRRAPRLARGAMTQ